MLANVLEIITCKTKHKIFTEHSWKKCIFRFACKHGLNGITAILQTCNLKSDSILKTEDWKVVWVSNVTVKSCLERKNWTELKVSTLSLISMADEEWALSTRGHESVCQIASQSVKRQETDRRTDGHTDNTTVTSIAIAGTAAAFNYCHTMLPTETWHSVTRAQSKHATKYCAPGGTDISPRTESSILTATLKTNSLHYDRTQASQQAYKNVPYENVPILSRCTRL